MSSVKTYDVIIIGAGSIGLPLSFELAKKGVKVGVIDKNASAGRGENRAALGGIRATHSDPAKIGICRRSITIFNAFEKEHNFDVDWISGGYLFPVYDETLEEALKKLLVIQKEHNLNIDWVSKDRVKELVPGITEENLRGGTFSPEDGSASPLKTALAYKTLATRKGVDFLFNEKVTGLTTKGNKVEKVTTDGDTYSCATLVNAAGAFARQIGKMVGLDIPVFPDSHEGGVTEPMQRFFEPMVVDLRKDKGSATYYFYQNKEGPVIFCLTPDPKIDGKDADCTSSFLPMVTKRMVSLYPRLRNIRVRRTWRGLYPMTPDGFPIVGRPKEIGNMILAVGMCGQGFMLGPGLGEILAEIITTTTTTKENQLQKENQQILDQLSLYRDFGSQEVLK